MDAILSITNERIIPVLETWDTVDAVLCLRFGGDRYDPSFFISYDVYYDEAVPPPDQRAQALPFAAGFETTLDGQKDRFLVEDVPVRLEYKSIHGIAAQIRAAKREGDPEVVTQTYGFYRIQAGQELLSRSPWLEQTRNALRELPVTFWQHQAWFYRARMDHSLSDLSSAAYAGEELFFQISLASFLENLASLLFAINREFEPAGRALRPALQKLSILPEEFETRLEYLLDTGGQVGKNRKREIAQLIARSVLRLQ